MGFGANNGRYYYRIAVPYQNPPAFADAKKKEIPREVIAEAVKKGVFNNMNIYYNHLDDEESISNENNEITVVGKTFGAWQDKMSGNLYVRFGIDRESAGGPAIIEVMQKKGLGYVSLGTAESDDIVPTVYKFDEMSVCKKGARPGTIVLKEGDNMEKLMNDMIPWPNSESNYNETDYLFYKDPKSENNNVEIIASRMKDLSVNLDFAQPVKCSKEFVNLRYSQSM